MGLGYNRDVPGVRFARGFQGHIPLRFEGAPDGPFRGEAGKWAGVKTTEHGELCRAFGVAEVGFYWELGPGLRGMSAENFARRCSSSARLDGFLFQHGRNSPVAKIVLVREGERFRDFDPTSRRDWEILSR
jgi:hypothetical protein